MTDAIDELARRAAARVGASVGGKYRIDRVLGIGGMASVFAATHRNGHRVALKLLHPELSIRADIRLRFLREGQASNSVKHAGVVTVIDDGIAEDGSALLVMELLEGESLEEMWARQGGKLPPRLVLRLGWDLCGVLQAAHEAGVVHRDIKPANLFLTRSGQLKVLDFGLAQVRDAAVPTLTATGEVFGTPAFMAPEQAGGRTSQVDAQTDLWAAGATMFTLLSGLTVHEGETGQHLAMRAATKPARSLATVLPTAATPLVALVDRALAFKKRDRWATASVMRVAIHRTAQDLFGDTPLELVELDELTRVREPVFASGFEGDTPSSEGAAVESSTEMNRYGATDSADTFREFEPPTRVVDAGRGESSDTQEYVRAGPLGTEASDLERTVRKPIPEPAPPSPERRARAAAAATNLPPGPPLAMARRDRRPMARPALPRLFEDVLSSVTRGAAPSRAIIVVAVAVPIAGIMLGLLGSQVISRVRARHAVEAESAPLIDRDRDDEARTTSAVAQTSSSAVATVSSSAEVANLADIEPPTASANSPRPAAAAGPHAPAPTWPKLGAAPPGATGADGGPRSAACSPPYTRDATGQKRWKLECL